jgi:hypothetical protein
MLSRVRGAVAGRLSPYIFAAGVSQVLELSEQLGEGD